MDNRITDHIKLSATPYTVGNVTGLDRNTLEWLRTQEPQEKIVPGDDLDDAVSVFNIDDLHAAIDGNRLDDDDDVHDMIYKEINAIVKKFLAEGIDMVVFDEL
jgi:hypothetical protein